MTRTPTPTAERYLDVLRSLGVSDAAVRRHHDVDLGSSLAVALAGELSAPTDQLLDVLAGTGVVLDLDATTDDDADRLELSLARFGFDADCARVGGDVEVVARDAVTDAVAHLRAPPERDALLGALRERVLDGTGVVAVPLVDGRTLVGDRCAIAGLQDRYGVRLEPFATPLLSVGIDAVDAPAPTTRPGAPGAGAPAPATRSAEARSDASAARAEIADAGDAPAAGDGAAADAESPTPAAEASSSVADVLASADEETASAIQDALAESGPAVHTADDVEDDVDAARAERVGGGPRRTVSATGIDQVFDEIEAAAADEAADRSSVSDDGSDPFTTPMEDDGGDHASGNDASRGGASGGSLAGGGPKRTVSETSADDILAQAGGQADFEDIADEEGDADPDAVLDDGDADIPALEEGQGDATGDLVDDDTDESPRDGGDESGDPSAGTGDAESGADERLFFDGGTEPGVETPDRADAADAVDTGDPVDAAVRAASETSPPADLVDGTAQSRGAADRDDGRDSGPNTEAEAADEADSGPAPIDPESVRTSKAGRRSTDGPLATAGGVDPASAGADSAPGSEESPTGADDSGAEPGGEESGGSSDDGSSPGLLQRLRSLVGL